MKEYKYKRGDVIALLRKNAHPTICLVIELKKRMCYHEVKVFSHGKVFTIVDDGFYDTQLIAGVDFEERVTGKII